MNLTIQFKDYQYKRPDIKEIGEKFNSLLTNFNDARSGDEQYEIMRQVDGLRNDFDTMSRIASIRHTINTKDNFYNDEHEFFDNVSPVYCGYVDEYYRALVNSKFRKELEHKTGKELFAVAELSIKTFSPQIVNDLKIENHLVTEYVKLVASAKIMFEGEERNLAGMVPFMQSVNRQVRKSASEARWKFFEDNEEKFDRIYDDLVKVRTRIAGKLGYRNFIQLGYDRMGRTDYTYKEVEGFRKQVEEYIVPVTETLKDMQRERIGLSKLYYYDLEFNFKSGNPAPKGSPPWIVEKARKMYEELSNETGVFMNFMINRDLMDLYNRKEKAAGGYCSYISNYKSPFIFSNMNGTYDDIRVLTHEAGHAFQAYESRDFEIPEYIHPTSEACEIHSMSMEFITWPWMGLFFENDTDKFLFLHLSRALCFIPYGVTVDEFQHFVYENPNASPDERKKMWRDIEKKYLPFRDFEDNDFLNRGGFWFYQGHIFRKPFYYIDYCLAQICALQFWRKFNHDRDLAWKDYLDLCKTGGSKSFLELIKVAKIDSPFDKNAVKSIVSYADEWIESVNKEFNFDETP